MTYHLLQPTLHPETLRDVRQVGVRATGVHEGEYIELDWNKRNWGHEQRDTYEARVPVHGRIVHVEVKGKDVDMVADVFTNFRDRIVAIDNLARELVMDKLDGLFVLDRIARGRIVQ